MFSKYNVDSMLLYSYIKNREYKKLKIEFILFIRGGIVMDINFFIAKSFEEAVSLKKQYGSTGKYIVGGTELNVRINKDDYNVLIDISNLISHEINWNNDKTEIFVGAGATFQEIYKNEDAPYQLRMAAEYMSTHNIRNMATIGGNIGTGSTVWDFIPTLLVLQAKLKLFDCEELITVERYIEEKIECLIQYVVISKENLDKIYNSKSYRRVSSDFSIIGVAVTYKKVHNTYTDIKIAVGGRGAKVKRVREVEKELEGKELTREIIMKIMQEKVKSRSSILRGSAEFREYTAAEMAAQCFGL